MINEKQKDALMLEYQPHLKYLVFDNEHSHLVNALPYLDEKPDADPTLKDKVTSLIKQEMRSMQKDKDYL